MDIVVRFQEKDATIRFIPGKVSLNQILSRYDETPFEVTANLPIVTIVRTEQFTIRGWTARNKLVPQNTKSNSDDTNKKQTAGDGSLPTITLNVEFVPATGNHSVSKPQLSLSDPPATGFELENDFDEFGQSKPTGGNTTTARANARLFQTVAEYSKEVLLPIDFQSATDKDEIEYKGRLDLVLLPEPAKPVADATPSTGVALVGGALELRLGHLCDQSGCVSHFHKSLANIPGVAAVSPTPDLKNPRATLFLQADGPVDIWELRQTLRDRGVEISGMTPQNLDAYRLRIELPTWRANKNSLDILQSVQCRDGVMAIIKELSYVKNAKVAAGGISFEPAQAKIDFVELINALTAKGSAPQALWLVPRGVAMPKSNSPQLAQPKGLPKQGRTQSQPIVELDIPHVSDIGTDVLSLLGNQSWATRTQLESEQADLALLTLGERKFANVMPLLRELRATGRIPSQIRLREFGDIRIRLEFANICGDVEYSKPPKRKKSAKKAKDKSTSKPRPFVPKPLRPASTSNGRRAIEAAIANVAWIKEGQFLDFHTKPIFNGPKKLELALQAGGEDVVQLEQLIDALQKAGFPPTSVNVSRRFLGIPFSKPLPGDLQLTDSTGKLRSLASMKQTGRPIAFAFVALKCPPKYKKYTPDPTYYEHLKQTIDKYHDRVDFIAVSSSKDDEFSEVLEFWSQTAVADVPLLRDADGKVRTAFNAQVTPAPHLYVFDANGLLRYGGDAHDNWESSDPPKEFYIDQALELVFAGKYKTNGAVFFNKSLCNCSAPSLSPRTT